MSEIESLHIRASDIFQEIATSMAKSKKPLHVNFPSGWIRPLGKHTKRWPYLPAERRRTVACAIQLCDVNRFYLSTFKVGLTAGSMWEWHVTLPVIAVIETLCYQVVVEEGWANEKVKFAKCIDILHSNGIFKHPFDGDLHKLREYRNEVHLYLKSKVQMHEGKPERYNLAVKALHKVEELLKEYYEK